MHSCAWARTSCQTTSFLVASSPSSKLAVHQPRLRRNTQLSMQPHPRRLVLVSVPGLCPQRRDALFQVSCQLLVSRLAVKVVSLLRIFLKIVELELLRFNKVVNQLESPGA